MPKSIVGDCLCRNTAGAPKPRVEETPKPTPAAEANQVGTANHLQKHFSGCAICSLVRGLLTWKWTAIHLPNAWQLARVS